MIRKRLTIFDFDKFLLKLARTRPVAMNGGYTQALNQQAGLALEVAALTASLTMTTPLPSGLFTLGSGGVLTITLPVPVAGPASEGGDDGKVLSFVVVTAHAHIVKCLTAGSFNGNVKTATSSGTIGDTLTLVAFGGVYYLITPNAANFGADGFTLS